MLILVVTSNFCTSVPNIGCTFVADLFPGIVSLADFFLDQLMIEEGSLLRKPPFFPGQELYEN